MSIEAMKQALEALEHDNPAGRSATITALHQAIEQAEKQDANEWYEKALWGDKQEPVAIPEGFSLVAVKGFHDLIYWLDRCERKGHLENCPDLVEPYESFDYRIIDDTAPPQREWVGLTVEDKDTIWYMVSCGLDYIPVSRADDLFYATEAKLKEKNHELS